MSLRKIALVGCLLVAASTLHAQKNTCKDVDQSITAVKLFKAELVNDNFKIGDFVFVDTANTAALEQAKIRFNKAGLAYDTLCNGSVTVFVNNPGKTWDQVEAIYNKLGGYLYLHVSAMSIRPVDKEDLF